LYWSKKYRASPGELPAYLIINQQLNRICSAL